MMFINMIQRAVGLNVQDPHLPEVAPQIESISHEDLSLLLKSGVSAAIDALPVTWGEISKRTDRPVAVSVSIARLALGPIGTEMIEHPYIRSIVYAARASRLYRDGRIPLPVVEVDYPFFTPATPQEVAGSYVGASPLNQDQIETLVGLARDGKEKDFRELAAMVGVRQDRIDDMWQGTRRRVRKEQ